VKQCKQCSANRIGTICIAAISNIIGAAISVSSKQSNFFFGSNRNKPKLNLFRLFFGLFRFVLVFRTGIETTETNRINLQTTLSIRVSSKQLPFFSVRTKTKRTSICFGCFSVCFLAKAKKFFCFVSVFWTGIETTETNRTYGMGN
jgi:hypothetical protein